MIRAAPSLILTLLLLAVVETAAAEDRVLRITNADCARLVKHRPAPDVAYQPGVDVYGDPVAPADLDGRPLALPETIVIPITVDLQERFGIPADSALFEAEALVGVVTVEGDRIFFNGRPLGDPEIDALAEACRGGAADRP